MIENIILDMGNVLLTYDPQVCLDAYCTSQEEKDTIRKALFGSETWLDADRGYVKNADFYSLLKDTVPPPYRLALQNCCAHWDICMQPIAGAREFCEFAKENRYRLYILSNASDLFYQYFPRFLPLDFFDGVVVSSDIHIIKPDKRAFAYVLDTYGLAPEACLFVDDYLCNVESAKALGMHALQFSGYESIYAFLADNRL